MHKQHQSAHELAAEDCHSVSMEDAPEGFETISEGAASVLYRPGESFYNPAQVPVLAPLAGFTLAPILSGCQPRPLCDDAPDIR